MPAYFSNAMIVKYLVVAFTYVWGGVEIFQQIRQRKQGHGQPDDKGSLILLYACIILGYAIGIPFSFSKYGRLGWEAPYFIACGILLILGGLYTRFSAMRTLAAYFTYEVGIQAEHVLVEKGLYRYIRHPGYLGELLIFLGIGLALTNWISLIGLFLPVLIAFNRRMSVEEKVLQTHFAAQYEAYRKRTWRLVPWVY